MKFAHLDLKVFLSPVHWASEVSSSLNITRIVIPCWSWGKSGKGPWEYDNIEDGYSCDTLRNWDLRVLSPWLVNYFPLLFCSAFLTNGVLFLNSESVFSCKKIDQTEISTGKKERRVLGGGSAATVSVTIFQTDKFWSFDIIYLATSI